MAISTYKVFLMYKATSNAEYSKLLDITSFSDLMGSPQQLDTTTLSDYMHTYIAGIKDSEALKFGANYDKTVFNTINGMEGTVYDFAVWFGGTFSADTGAVTPTGAEGKFSCKGTVSAAVNGGGVNEVIGMEVTVTPSTTLAFSAS